MENLKYPIGRFDQSIIRTNAEVLEAIEYLKSFPEILRVKLKNITEQQLDTLYRPEGWTTRQVVHHLADSHANMYVRVKVTLMEDNPSIKGYDEAEWAQQADYLLPLESSLRILEGMHERICALLQTLHASVYDKTYYHPGYQKTFVLRNVICLYHWHSKHHLAHIDLVLNA